MARRNRGQNPEAHAGGEVKAIVGRVVIVVLALAVCALPPIFVNDIIGYLPLVALVLLLIISFVYLQVLKRAFSFDEGSLATSCERGSDIDFVLHFRNSSPLVFVRLEPYIYISDLFGGLDTITPISLTLMPFENREFRFQATFDHIGSYSAGVSKVKIYDLLGLFSHTLKNENRHRVEVMPRLFNLEDLALSSETTSESAKPRQAITVDDMDYAGVRDYTWGDPIKTIHWKLSARNPSGEYLTRLFETYNNPGIAIILDTSSPNYSSEQLMSVFDSVVESALSVNQFAVDAGVDSVLEFRNMSNEEEKMRIMDMGDFPDLISSLRRVHVGNGDRALDLLRRELNTLHGQDNVAMCTPHVSADVIELLISLKLHKRNPMMFLIVPPDMPSDEVKKYSMPLKRLSDAQIPSYVLSSASSLGVEEEHS